MAKKNDNDNGGIITDKTELEKLLKQHKPIKIPGINKIKKLLEPASCYLTGPPLPDYDEKGIFDDDVTASDDDEKQTDDAPEGAEPMCYDMGPPADPSDK